jgi:uncharacterized membrane protein YcaP (DUF421 family)
MNAFDLVVTVALGSTLATALLTETVSYTEGLLGLGVLIGLQYIVATLARKMPSSEGWLKSEPRALLRDGEFDQKALREERVTEGEVRAALRQAKVRNLKDAAAIVLESDGSFSVVPAGVGEGTASTLADVR